MTQIADKLALARRSRMVGREAECALFRSALETEELPFCLLHISGPGGVGKSTLLQAFRDLCDVQGAQAFFLDARNIEPSPDAFLAALRAVLGLVTTDDPLAALTREPDARRVLFVDTYESLDGLDGWVREALVPRLPASTLVVLAGRTPLAAAWRSDAGWQRLARAVALRNLSPVEARAYLHNSGVPAFQHQAALLFTHGHPLALSLVVDVLAQQRAVGIEALPADVLLFPSAVPDVVQDLLGRLVQEVPSFAHRAALETCALVRLTDEALLTEMLREEASADAPALFRWLRGLSFIEKNSDGVFPHDVVREALLADLRWRNRERYADLHRRARAYYAARLQSADGLHRQQSLLYDCVFLHRDNAVVRAAFTWQQDQVFPDTLRVSDHDHIAGMVARHEGEASARIARRWLSLQPESTLVFRMSVAEGAGRPVGFLTLLNLHLAEEQDRANDPAARAAWEYLTTHHAPLRSGEEAACLRFWMAHDTYQEPSPVQSLIIVNALRQFLTRPRLAFTFFVCGDADQWEPLFDYVEVPRLREAEFAVAGRSFGVFGSDWRERPATNWLTRLAEKETRGGAAVAGANSSAPPPPPAAPPPPLVVLSETAFKAAVRDALRAYKNEAILRRNPLLRSSLVEKRTGAGADAGARADALRFLLHEAAQALAGSPRLARGWRALRHTYFEPAATQDQAADLLDLPFSTYRRHLGEGIDELTQLLWIQDTG